MTILQRAATLAAMTFMLAGLIGTSTPGLATELNRTAIVSPSVITPNDPVQPVVPTPAPTVTPANLDQAIATEDLAVADPADDETLRCLAGAIYFEAKGEPMAGQLAVADVILNRTKSGRFPADVCGVVKQPGQFSFVRGGTIPSVDEDRPAWRTAMAVAKVAMGSHDEGEAGNALFFHARSAGIGGRFVRVAAIGNHIFYR